VKTRNQREKACAWGPAAKRNWRRVREHLGRSKREKAARASVFVVHSRRLLGNEEREEGESRRKSEGGEKRRGGKIKNSSVSFREIVERGRGAEPGFNSI